MKPGTDTHGRHGPPVRRQHAAAIEELAKKVERLAPDRHDPERFWERKSEVADALRRVAREVADG
jgi:hypothetical protein